MSDDLLLLGVDDDALGGGGGGTSEYVGYTNLSGDGFPYTFAVDMTGAAPGFLLVVALFVGRQGDDPLSASGLPVLDGSGDPLIQVSRDQWATVTGVTPSQAYLLYKELDAADISTGTMTVPGYGGFEGFMYSTMIFDGGTTVTKKDFVSSAARTDTNLVFDGYAQTGGTAVIATICYNDQLDQIFTVPSPFSAVLANSGTGLGVDSHYSNAIFVAGSNLSAITYTLDGFCLTTSSDASHKGQAGYLFEIG